MEVLTTESLEKLRSECKLNPELVLVNFKDIVDKYNLILIPLNDVSFDLRDLQMPDGFKQEKNKDLENCKIIGESLRNLKPSQATDERLWATLCFDRYAPYARARWPLDQATTLEKKENRVQEHWFARTNRNRMRDNAIARLWWMAHIAQKVDSNSYDTVLSTLFFNSDYRSSLLERNSSANAINVLVSVLEISQEAFANGIEYNRENFRNFMKQVDLLGKRTSLPSLSKEDLKVLLAPVYQEAYQAKGRAKRGFLSRILKH